MFSRRLNFQTSPDEVVWTFWKTIGSGSYFHRNLKLLYPICILPIRSTIAWTSRQRSTSSERMTGHKAIVYKTLKVGEITTRQDCMFIHQNWWLLELQQKKTNVWTNPITSIEPSEKKTEFSSSFQSPLFLLVCGICSNEKDDNLSFGTHLPTTLGIVHETGCFLKWWYSGTPISHPKRIMFSRKTNGCWGNPPFSETPIWKLAVPKAPSPPATKKFSKWPAEGLATWSLFEQLHVSLRSMGLLFLLTYTPDIGSNHHVQ